MAILISNSPDETQALGERWGNHAMSGLVIGLTGELGAGKTELVKGIARGLGVASKVHSPTFTLVNEYEGGRFRLFHLDLYRLDAPEQIIAAGLEDYFWRPDGVAVIEWAERWFGPAPTSTPASRRLPDHYRRVRIEHLSERQRRITCEDFGS
jgi:tRNA threonylcarbamoyladenosine biosynthesis protein TsaE